MSAEPDSLIERARRFVGGNRERSGNALVVDESVDVRLGLKLVTLALASGDWEGSVGDAIPSSVWDDLYDAGLLRTGSSGAPGDGPFPELTPEGKAFLIQAIMGDAAPYSRSARRGTAGGRDV